MRIFGSKLAKIAIATQAFGSSQALAAKAENKFAVINFFDPEDPQSAKMSSLIEGAKKVLADKAASGEWNKRKVNWLDFDLVSQGDSKPSKVTGPNQMIFYGSGKKALEKLINFQPRWSEDMTGEEERFAQIVYALTGDWYTEITCDLLMDETREFHNEIVFLGPTEDFEDGGKG